MSTTPLGVIVHWPGVDPDLALLEVDDFYSAPSTSCVHPFQEGRELDFTLDDEFNGRNNPERQLFASTQIPFSSNDPSREQFASWTDSWLLQVLS